MYETFPKKSAHPSKSVGEQESSTWPDNQKTEYPGSGASGTVYNGARSKTKVCNGGNGSPNKSDYPGHKYETFGTEKMDKR